MELHARVVHAMETSDVETVASLLPAAMTVGVVRGNRARQPLVQLAIQLNEPQILDLLLTHGCAFQENEAEDEEEEYEDEEENDDVYHGCSPLNLAVQQGHDDCIRVLLAHGASVDTPCRVDNTYYTPLHVAALLPSADQINRLLPSSRAIGARDMGDSTPLHLAVTYDCFEPTNALLAAGADIHATNASDASPLHCASAYGYVSMVQLLLDRGANVEARDVDGCTPLIIASESPVSSAEHAVCLVEVLLACGADANAQTRQGDSALFGAVRNNNLAAVVALLTSGASVALQNRKNESVLHIAARAKVSTVEIWKRLVVAGADVHARDRNGQTCYDIWERSAAGLKNEDNEPIAQLLQSSIDVPPTGTSTDEPVRQLPKRPRYHDYDR